MQILCKFCTTSDKINVAQTCWKMILEHSVPCFMASPPSSQIAPVPLTVLILAEGPAPWTRQSKPVHHAFPDMSGNREMETLSASVRSIYPAPKRILYTFFSFLLFHFSFCLPAVCSGAPNCAALNRYPCSEVPNTCGRCFPRHLGVEGFSNESCFGMSYYTINRPGPLGQSSNSFSHCFKSKVL